eukprot:TRINITY_DN1592_c0_g1_i1.p1 TRINITY_DN1592_c0_g1~~TRINITY_DN1592_c0_g1_i1.p1  ORF type:complete len:943 (+),score=208.47 TRINITY_DN1592_c0_g1_i1:380-3208(+)
MFEKKRVELEKIRKHRLDELNEGSDNQNWDTYLESVALTPSTQVRLNNAQIVSVLRGFPANEYHLSSGLVRLFTSSTFTDTKEERNYLMKHIYPRLRQLCQKFAHDFTVVDMRWGVRDESTEDHLTSFLCMRELRRCQELSAGPNFVTFVGDKYGYRPFPAKIDKGEFDRMLNWLLENGHDTSILEQCFVEDLNSIPVNRVLQKISLILPDYNSPEVPKRKAARSKWWNYFETMQHQLRTASCVLEDERRRDAYIISVTEEEIHNGILYASDLEKTYCFRRTIRSIDQTSPLAPSFIDMEWTTGSAKVDQDAQINLAELKNSKIPKAFSNANLLSHIRDYSVDWGKGWIDLQGDPKHKEYFDSFIKDFQETMCAGIISGLEKVTWAMPNPPYEEAASHIQFMQSKVQDFEGFDEFIRSLTNYALDNSIRYPMIIHGRGGTGKSAILARVAHDLRNSLPASGYVIARFLGTSTYSSSARSLAQSICQLLWQVKNSNHDMSQCDITEDWDLIKQQHWSSLVTATPDRPIVFIFDSLDSLRNKDDKNLLDLIPLELPQNIHMILSVNSGGEFYELLRKKIVDQRAFVEVPSLEPSQGMDIFSKYMRNQNRALSEEQNGVISRAIHSNRNPLYVRLLVDIAVQWTSVQSVSSSDIPSDVDSAIGAIFSRLEYYHGLLFTSHSLSYITISNNGVSESELDDVMSLDDECLDDIFQYWEPPVRRLPPLLWTRLSMDLEEFLIQRAASGVLVFDWFHAQFKNVALSRYLDEKEVLKSRHRHLGTYFSGGWAESKPYFNKQRNRWLEANRQINPQKTIFKEDTKEGTKTIFNARKVTELPYHLRRAVMEQEFEAIMLETSFIRACVKTSHFFDLLREAIGFKDDGHGTERFRSVIQFLQDQASSISGDPSILYSPTAQKDLLMKMGFKLVEDIFSPQGLSGLQKLFKFLA